MEEFTSLGIPTPTPSRVRFQRHRCTSRPRLPDSLKPTPTLSPTPIVSLTTTRVAGLLSPTDLQVRQRLDELQSNLRTHSEHKKKVFNYLVTVKSKRQEEEGGELDISEGDVTEHAIAENMLDVLDTLDELLSGADQRLMKRGAEPKGPRPLPRTIEQLKKGMMGDVTGECGDMFGDMKLRKPLPEPLQGRTNKPEHGGSVNCSYKLPAWKAMMDEDTPPGSPFSRTLFGEDHVEGEPVIELVPDHLVKNDEEVKAKAEPFEPQMTSTAAVKAMFEKFLGSNNTAETATNISSEGEGKATDKSNGQVQQSVQDIDFMEKRGDLVPSAPPRIVRRKQQQQKGGEAHGAQGESQFAQSKSPLPRSRLPILISML